MGGGIEERQEEGKRRRRRKTVQKDRDERECNVKIIKKKVGRMW